MKSSEIIRALVDTLSNIATNDQPQVDNTEMHLAQTKAANVENAEKAEAAKEDLGDFIPPLQQKLELLKKAVDVDSYFDEDESDELVIIKKNAGINPIVLDALGDDDPLEG
jgi:hypothetical protein